MKQRGKRGRHRRRKRGRALRGFLAGTALALTAAATMITASQATVADDPGALKPLTSPSDTAPLRLREHLVPRRTLDRLATAMGRPVGVDAVLRSADRALLDAADCTSAERATLPVAPAATRAYCWDPADTATPDWRPASVTASGDAAHTGTRESHGVILAGWTHSATAGSSTERGLARVAFVDATDPARLAYRWVLLAVPTADGRDYRGLVSPVSGMVRYQDKLLVTAGRGTAEALYVYDLNRIQRTTVAAPAIGRVPGGWSADGYGYVMPAVGSYRFTTGPCGSDDTDAPCPGTLSLDRGPATAGLVASEWTPADSDHRARLWRYAFSVDPSRAGLLDTDAAGRVKAVEAYRTRAAGIRGVLAYHRTGSARPAFYLGRVPDSRSGHGGLWRQDTDGARATRCGADATHLCWAQEPGSLSYGQERGEVWSLSGRMLFSVPLGSIDSSLG
ncbi:hypothetical protein [Streptomyces sp. NPDC054794]